GFVGHRCEHCGAIHLPPVRVCVKCGAVDRMSDVPMADATGTVTTFTVDRLAFTPSPPMVAVVVDFAEGGRFRCQLTDADPDMLLDAATATLASAGMTLDDIDAYWLGTAASGISGLTLSRALRIGDKPVTRLENMCATGSEALRNASYAVASGAYDVAMAIGV